MILYAATSNRNKLAEFSTAATDGGHAIDILPLPGINFLPEPVEDAPTFLGNAEKKALAYSLAAPGLLVFADDSGLEADALGGQPGVRSARFANDLNFEPGQGSKDERNNRCLLALLQHLNAPTRAARFVCALALARDGPLLHTAEGTVEGQILQAPRGNDGFGYDPLFLIPSLGLTLAEVTRDQKWNLSHRGHAFRQLLTQLRSN